MYAVNNEINMKYPECYTLQCIALHGIHMQFAELGRASKQIRFSDFICFFFAGGNMYNSKQNQLAGLVLGKYPGNGREKGTINCVWRNGVRPGDLYV